MSGGYYKFGKTHKLLLALEEVDEQERADIECGRAEFAIGTHNDLMFFFFRFGETISWSDACYNWHLSDRAPFEEDTEQELVIRLYDLDKNAFTAERTVLLPEYFANYVNGVINRQISRRFDPRQYYYDLSRAYSEWSSEDLLVQYAESFFGVESCS